MIGLANASNLLDLRFDDRFSLDSMMARVRAEEKYGKISLKRWVMVKRQVQLSFLNEKTTSLFVFNLFSLYDVAKLNLLCLQTVADICTPHHSIFSGSINTTMLITFSKDKVNNWNHPTISIITDARIVPVLAESLTFCNNLIF